MPQPTAGAVHVNRPLTNISVAYANNGDFVARRMFPVVPVSKKSDSYFKYTKADWLRSQAQVRAPGTESAGSGWTLSTDTYVCDVVAIHKDIDDQVRENQDAPLNLDREAAMWTTRQILLKMETDFQSNFFTTGIWTGSTTGTDITPATLWSAATGDPVNDITTQQDYNQSITGNQAKHILAGVDVTREIRNNADVIDRIKYTQRGVATLDLLAALFNVDSYMVGNAIVDTSTEGAATDSPGFIFGSKDLLLAYRPASASLMEASAGYTFTWTGLAGGSQGYSTKKFRMEHLESDRVETQTAYDQKVVASDAGVFFDEAVA